MFSSFLSTTIVEFALYPAVFPIFIHIFVKFFTNFLDFLCVFTFFSGYFIAGIAGGLGHKQALLQASAAAALAVTKKGAAPSVPERSAVEAFIGERV